MRKADLVASISEKTGIAKVDVLVSLESFFKEVRIWLICSQEAGQEDWSPHQREQGNRNPRALHPGL